MLNNAKHEHFANLIAKGERAAAAYVKAGFSSGGAAQSASRLLQRAEVRTRVEELRIQHSAPTKKMSASKRWVMEELVELVRVGLGRDKLRALELIGKELGMFQQRNPHSAPPIRRFADMTEEELDALVEDATAQYGEERVRGDVR